MAQGLLHIKYQIIEAFWEDFYFLNILHSIGSVGFHADKATQADVPSALSSFFSVVTLGKDLC